MRILLRRLRYIGPVVLGAACLVAAYYVPPFVTYLLVLASFALLFEAGTAWFARAGGTGGMKDYRQ
jgi:hypothetical protein